MVWPLSERPALPVGGVRPARADQSQQPPALSPAGDPGGSRRHPRVGLHIEPFQRRGMIRQPEGSHGQAGRHHPRRVQPSRQESGERHLIAHHTRLHGLLDPARMRHRTGRAAPVGEKSRPRWLDAFVTP